VKTDPPVSGDKTCVQCGGNRVVPEKRYASVEQFERDPFCSRVCCEEWHEVRPLQARCPGCGKPMKDATAFQCVECRKRERMESRPEDVIHGRAYAYRNLGCKCELCRGYASAQRRRWRAANPERARESDRRQKARRKLRSAKRGRTPSVVASPSATGPATPSKRKAA